MSAAGETRNRANSSHHDSPEERELGIPVVRKLKDPPEIWELVQPLQPKPRRAFLSRLASGRTIFILLVAVILGAGGYVGVRSGKRIAGASSSRVEKSQPVDSNKATAAGSEKATTQASNVPAPVVASSVEPTTAVADSEKPKRKLMQRSKAIGDASGVSKSVSAIATANGSAVSLPSNSKPKISETSATSSVDAGSSPKPKPSLSPQLIDSQKAAPQKPKVIQWP